MDGFVISKHANISLVFFSTQMPTTIEELEAAIQDTTSEANSILFVNHNVLEQYETRERQVSL